MSDKQEDTIILVNDYCYGLLGEKMVLWNFMLDHIPNIKAVDLDIICTDAEIKILPLSFEKKVLKYIEKHYSNYKCIIQNGSWFPLIPSNKPRICIIQDNLRKMHRCSEIQETNFKNAEYIVTNSCEVDKYYYERKTTQIPLCLDTELFCIKDKNYLREYYGIHLGNKKKIGIFVGALNEVKGWDTIKNIIDNNLDILWIIISKYNTDNYFKENVLFYNTVNQDVLSDLLNLSNFFILGSPSETQCLAALEACLCNIPIIMRNTGFVTNLSEDEKKKIGFIGDNLQESVLKMKELTLDFCPREIVLKYVSVDIMINKWKSLLESIPRTL
jgi:hypothetical protein